MFVIVTLLTVSNSCNCFTVVELSCFTTMLLTLEFDINLQIIVMLSLLVTFAFCNALFDIDDASY